MAKNNDTQALFQKYSEITPEAFAALQKEHGKLRIITVPLMDEEDEDFDPEAVAKYVLKLNPKRSVIKAIKNLTTKEFINLDKIEQLSANEVLLGGDMIYLEEDKGDYQVYMAVDAAIGKIVKGRTAKVGKR